MSPRPAAVLWDMDGTIVDTEPYWIATEYELVAEFGGEWDDEKAHSLVGKDLRDSAAIIRDRGGVDMAIDDIVNRLLDGVIARVRQRVPWRPGAKELLAAVRKAGVPNALVTMSWTRFAVAVVDQLPPGTFEVVITGDEVSQGKPHPEPYLTAAAKLGVSAKDCVAIEDSPTGVRSAVAAGCRTFAVPNVVDIPASRAYTRVGSMVELTPEMLGITATAAPRRKRRWGVLAGGLAAVAAVGAAAVVVLREDAPPPLPDIPFSGWAPYWALPEATESVNANGAMLHEVSPFWFETKDERTIALSGSTTPAQTEPFVASIRTSGAAVIPSISDGMPKGAMAAMLADPARRSAHVDAITNLVRANDFDGIDLDYEGFAFVDGKASWEATRPNWVLFVRDLAAVLHAEGKRLVVSVPPIYDSGRTGDSGYWVYDYAAMGDIVDAIRIMGYDYSVSEPGPIAPYDWVKVAVQAAKRVVDDDSKLVLGVGTYGRNWVVGTTGTCPATAEGNTSVSLRNVEDLMTRRSATATHDPVTREASFSYQLKVEDGGVSCTQSRQVHFIDEEGVLARVDLAREQRIGGVSLWAIGFDSPLVWTTVAPWMRPRGVAPDGSTTTTAQP
ncbi:MAG: HAD-IA family hydrolase [Ilumatobacteraceae bacterium]